MIMLSLFVSQNRLAPHMPWIIVEWCGCIDSWIRELGSRVQLLLAALAVFTYWFQHWLCILLYVGACSDIPCANRRDVWDFSVDLGFGGRLLFPRSLTPIEHLPGPYWSHLRRLVVNLCLLTLLFHSFWDSLCAALISSIACAAEEFGICFY